MPIRFRCAYCNQLLGIARRKAGQVVRCPTCAGQVVVPTPEEGGNADVEAEAEGPAPAAGDGPPVFERSDFDQIFQVPEGPEPAAVPAPTAAPGTAATGPPHDFGRFDVDPLPAPSLVPPPPASLPDFGPQPGLVLSPKKATVLTVLWIVTVAIAFGVGLVVGLSLK
jgi:hypothetical protein